MGHARIAAEPRPAGTRWPEPPRWGRRRCRWAPAVRRTSSSGSGPAGRSPPSPPAARTAWCRWRPDRSSTGGCSAAITAGGSTPTAAAWTSPRSGTPRHRRPAPTWTCRGRSRSGTAGSGWPPSAPRRRPRRGPPPATSVSRSRAPAAPAGPVFGNLDPSLEHAWHPVALSRELRPGGWLQVRLLGRTWMLRRTGRRSRGGSPGVRRPGAVRRRLARPGRAGRRPPRPAGGRRPALRRGLAAAAALPGPAGPVADNFLDVAHFAFVHGATFGAEDRPEVPVYDVVPEPGGFRSTQEQWCENPTDPEVARGGRPLRQRRRATYVYRAPFSFRVSLEYLDTGATTTILFLLQPEDADSTRIYTCLFLSAGHGATAALRPPSSPRRWPSTGGCWRRTSGSWASWPARPAAGRARGAARPGGPAGRRAAPGALRLRDGEAGRAPPPDQSSGSSAPQAGQRVGGSSSASRPQAGQTRRSQQAGSPPSSRRAPVALVVRGHAPAFPPPGDVTDSTRCRAGMAGMLGRCRRHCSAAPP